MNLKMKAAFAPNLRLALSLAIAAGELLVFGSARSQIAQAPAQAERKTIMTMKDDLANRSRDIHWPAGFDPAKADLFAHNELVIHAPANVSGSTSSMRPSGLSGIRTRRLSK